MNTFKIGDKVIRKTITAQSIMSTYGFNYRPGPEKGMVATVESIDGDYIALKEWPSRDGEFHPWYFGNFLKVEE